MELNDIAQKATGRFDVLLEMERSIRANPFESELVRRYYDESVIAEKSQTAAVFFEEMLARHPRHNQIRTLLISLYLQNDQPALAMEAIEALLTSLSKPEEGLIDAAINVRQKIGPMKLEKGSAAHPTLCVCMIVRNEQTLLGPCLHAIKPVADEIVVVDTGSTDRSADIARIFGAHVYDFTWADDFSAARNHGLQRVVSDWILILDADETIAPSDQLKLRKLVAENKNRPVALSLETRNYTHIANSLNCQANSGQYPEHETGLCWFPSRKIRLFPNKPEIRFRYPVHELVDASVREAGLTIEECDIPIHHYGHLNEKKNRKKAENYFNMGYDKLHQLGDDVAALRELAVQAGQLEYWSESLELWHKLLKVQPGFEEAYVNMSGAYWQLGRYSEAIEAAQGALRLNCRYKEAEYNYAVSLLLLGRAKEAADILNKLCTRVRGYLGAQFMLSASLVCAGDIAGGNERFCQLAKSIKPAALVLALKALIKRMRNSGEALYADQLDRTIGYLDTQYEMEIPACTGGLG